MRGRTLEEAQAQLLAKGMRRTRSKRSRRTASFPATGPSITIVYDKLDPSRSAG